MAGAARCQRVPSNNSAITYTLCETPTGLHGAAILGSPTMKTDCSSSDSRTTATSIATFGANGVATDEEDWHVETVAFLARHRAIAVGRRGARVDLFARRYWY